MLPAERSSWENRKKKEEKKGLECNLIHTAELMPVVCVRMCVCVFSILLFYEYNRCMVGVKDGMY